MYGTKYETTDGGSGFTDLALSIVNFNELKRHLLLIGFLMLGALLALIDPAASGPPLESLSNPPSPPSSGLSSFKPWYEVIQSKWGGHVKARGSASWPDDESLFQPVGTRTYCDGNTELRVKNKLLFGNWGSFETHYEAIYSKGDTRKKGKELEKLFPDLFSNGQLLGQPMEDDRRFFDLTKTIHKDDTAICYHRLDRLFLTVLPKWGSLSVGRQAVTWGNGLLFNPMDLFNPFSPTDIERDYKTGDDLATAHLRINSIGEFQLLYVPRRDPISGDAAWDQSSLAGKLHFARGTTELDIMAAEHYDDVVVGIGSAGYVGNAAWRLDATWTFLDEDRGTNNFLTLVANMDYSWAWLKKNFYGFLEFYFNGLSHNEYADAFTNKDISERLNRGELFALGRTYLSGHMRVELHPLFNAYLTVINNLADPSGVVQPRAAWDVTEDAQITFGGTIYYGGGGTEYGGFSIPGTDLLNKAPDNVFVWLAYFF